jgi:putative ABC transport system permease protein
MLRATLKSLLSRKLRLLLSGLAVVLGVMAVSGALIATDTVGKSFDSLFQTVNADLDVQVTGPQNVDVGVGEGTSFNEPVPAIVVDEVAAIPGVAKATGDVFLDGARVIGPNGKVIASRGPPSFGMAWQGESDLVELRQGRGPEAPNEVAINASLAEEGDFQLGDRLDVLTLQPKKTFDLVGVFGYSGGRDTLGGETRVAFTVPVAQELMLGKKDAFSAINVEGEDGVTRSELRDRVDGEIGPDYIVRTGEEVAEQESATTQGFLDILRNFLLGFAAVALLVGSFLILNTFSILVAQRTQELALFRALGAKRGQVIRAVLIEAVLVGLIASTLGLLAGFGVAALLKTFLESQSGASLPGAALTVPTSAIVASYLVGLIVTVVAALVPAVRASRIPPIAALREAARPDKPLTAITIAGAIPTVIGAALIGAALFGDLGQGTLMALLGGVLLVFIGVAMLTPIITRPAAGLLGRAFSWSMTGQLGRRNSARNPRRTAITAAALMIGIALVTGVSVLASSLKTSMEKLVTQDLGADLIIAGDVAGPTPATFDPAIIDATRQIPGVETAVPVYSDAIQVGNETAYADASDVSALARILALEPVAGELRTLSKGEVVVGEDFADNRKLAVGDTVEMATQRGGSQDFAVVGIHKQSQFLPGPLLSVEDGRTGFRSPQAATGYIVLADGADAGAVQQRVDELLRDNPEVSVRSQADFSAQLTSQVDTFATMLYVLLALAVVIAVLGIINTLALSILERTRELGLLRAVGMRRSQVRWMITIESIVISMFGAVLGMVVGAALGTAVARALSDEFIPELSFPWARLVVFVVVAVVVGLAAAIIPALRASRVNVLRAIAYE